MQNKIGQDIAKAVKLLQQGELVAFPSETVYGLGADASNEQAVKQIFIAKGRPSSNPLIVHIADITKLDNWAKNISIDAYKLAQHFWPGPLTLILPKAAGVSSLVTAGQDTVALRVPDHALAQNLLQNFGGGLVGPSANRSGKISPTCALDVFQELADKVSYILDGDICKVGIESTIVYCADNNIEPVILRYGIISKQEIEQVLGKKITAKDNTNDTSLITPGSALSHYAPDKDLQITGNINNFINEKDIAIISFSPKPTGFNNSWVEMPFDAKQYAKKLYATLRTLDQDNLVNKIIVEQVPDASSWLAIKDRLTRAASC